MSTRRKTAKVKTLQLKADGPLSQHYQEVKQTVDSWPEWKKSRFYSSCPEEGKKEKQST